VSGQRPDPALRTSAALAEANLRDELLAPGFLTPSLAERVRVARIAGVRINVRFGLQEDMTLVEMARALLAAALADLGEGDDVTLQVHPPAGGIRRCCSCMCAASGRTTRPCAGARNKSAPWSVTSVITSS